jgi:hypothetical protein
VDVRLLRVDPERVLRVLRELRELRSLRVMGTLPDPVRVEPEAVLVLAVGPAWGALPAVAGGEAAAAMPQTLQ